MTPRIPLLALAVLLCVPLASWAGAVPPPIKGPDCGGLTEDIVASAIAESAVKAAADGLAARLNLDQS